MVKTLRRVQIAGLGTYVPPQVLSNADLEKMVDTTNEWIVQRTGIRERHIVEPWRGNVGFGCSGRATPPSWKPG